ncbi:MAG: hypothetical protein IJP23_05395 [Oscillospiraceae bacterium]|nr:hypothetical protein [Oscillospiraceae bacterium]
MKVWELERYKAAYCGLCRAMKADYGAAMTFSLNYDFAFLALLLSGNRLEQEEYTCRCAAGCFKKRCAAVKTASMEAAAAAGVILLKWKLTDELSDPGGKKLAARAALLFLKRGFKKAERKLPGFDKAVGENVRRLAELEKAGCQSLDETADTFAELLASLDFLFEGEANRRCARELLYHTGRWIYIVDACDDLGEDAQKGAYNPLAGRFGLEGGELSPEQKERLRETLGASCAAAMSAAALMELGRDRGIIENIISLGMPSAANLVLAGQWPKTRPGRHSGKLN